MLSHTPCGKDPADKGPGEPTGLKSEDLSLNSSSATPCSLAIFLFCKTGIVSPQSSVRSMSKCEVPHVSSVQQIEWKQPDGDLGVHSLYDVVILPPDPVSV